MSTVLSLQQGMRLAWLSGSFSRLVSLTNVWSQTMSFIRDSRGFKYWKRTRLRKRKHYKI